MKFEDEAGDSMSPEELDELLLNVLNALGSVQEENVQGIEKIPDTPWIPFAVKGKSLLTKHITNGVVVKKTCKGNPTGRDLTIESKTFLCGTYIGNAGAKKPPDIIVPYYYN